MLIFQILISHDSMLLHCYFNLTDTLLFGVLLLNPVEDPQWFTLCGGGRSTFISFPDNYFSAEQDKKMGRKFLVINIDKI
jgi:hypothetical protein